MKLTAKFTKLAPGFLIVFVNFRIIFCMELCASHFTTFLNRFASHFGSFLGACGLHLEHFGRSWSRCGRVIGSLVDTLGLPGRPVTSNWGRLEVKFSAP